jgi:release factor glutamine methyltransferase
VLSEAEHARLHELVTRRASNEPVAYLVGHKAFRGIDLRVNQATLIPRPETETLVEVALEKLEEAGGTPPRGVASPEAPHVPAVAAAVVSLHQRRNLRLLDIGTGSGAVALAIAHEHPTVRVVATDVLPQALETARVNAARLGLAERVEFRPGDLFDDMPPGALFDVIVSNPPYVADADLDGTAPDVYRFEPHMALLGGAEGLDFYHRIVPGAPQFLRGGGWLAVEIADGKAAEVCAVFERCGRFERIEVRDDLGGTPRVVAAREKKLT